MIRNLTRKKCIASHPVILTSLASHILGLMFRRKITPHVLAFKTEKRVSLHTFFVSGPIDIIFVNKKNSVCEIKKNLWPFSFYMPKQQAKYIIELPAGTVKKSGTKVGDVIFCR